MSTNVFFSAAEKDYFFEIERTRVVLEENLNIVGYTPIFSC